MIKVLYIDDESINLNLFYVSFRKDFKVFKALSPAEGLKIFEEEEIDVVVTDQRMPGMTGIEVIREVKKRNQNMNCVLLTAYYEPELMDDEEFKSLVFRYVEKPFRKQQMREIIEQAAG